MTVVKEDIRVRRIQRRGLDGGRCFGVKTSEGKGGKIGTNMFNQT